LKRFRKWGIGLVAFYLFLLIFDIYFRNQSLIDIAKLMGIGLLLIFAINILGVILYTALPKRENLAETNRRDSVDEMIKEIAENEKWLQEVVVLSSIEELFFRGPLYIVLLFLELPWLMWTFIIIADGIIFGYMHFRESPFLSNFITHGIKGTLLSWLVIASGSLVPAIFCHLFSNLIWMSLFRWAEK